MIVTVYNQADFEEKTDFSKNIYYSCESRNIGTHLPRIEITQKVYGVGLGGASLTVYERLATVSVNDVDAPDLMHGIGEVVRARVASFEEEVKRLADTHGCRAIPGDLKPSPISAALSAMLEQELNAIDERLCRVEAEVLPPIFRKEIKNRVGVLDE